MDLDGFNLSAGEGPSLACCLQHQAMQLGSPSQSSCELDCFIFIYLIQDTYQFLGWLFMPIVLKKGRGSNVILIGKKPNWFPAMGFKNIKPLSSLGSRDRVTRINNINLSNINQGMNPKELMDRAWWDLKRGQFNLVIYGSKPGCYCLCRPKYRFSQAKFITKMSQKSKFCWLGLQCHWTEAIFYKHYWNVVLEKSFMEFMDCPKDK